MGSLLPHPQREVLVVSLTNKRKIFVPPSKRSSLCLFDFFPLSSPTLNERCSLSHRQIKEKFVYPPQREVLFAYLTFSLSPPHPQRAVLVVSLTNKRKICHPPSKRSSLCLF